MKGRTARRLRSGWLARLSPIPWKHRVRGRTALHLALWVASMTMCFTWLHGVGASQDAANTGRTPIHGHATSQAALAALTGKGVWWDTWGAISRAQALAIVRQAKQAGLTAIYPRVMDSVTGFYGEELLGALLPIAHAAGIDVVAWYWSDLSDPSLAIQVADYAVNGQRVDAISPDIEAEGPRQSVAAFAARRHESVAQATRDPRVRAILSQTGGASANTLAAYFSGIRDGADGLPGLGADYPIAATTWPTPDDHADYSFATMSRYCQVFTPMAYWRATGLHDTAAGVKDYVDTVFREYAEPSVNPYHRVISLIAQSYADPNGIAGSPSSAEETAAMRETRADGGIGVSFYDYADTTAEEWSAIAAYPWPGKSSRQG